MKRNRLRLYCLFFFVSMLSMGMTASPDHNQDLQKCSVEAGFERDRTTDQDVVCLSQFRLRRE